MHEQEHADARTRDRRLRERIDPLIGELSPQGKIELAFRLTMEGAREFAAGAIGRETPTHELPVITGSSTRKRDDGGEESSTRAPV